MLALSFELLAGRYHATGWDHHVNEGTIEWPPSPWRVLRALVAASYRAQVPASDTWRVLKRLVDLPVYAVPRASHAHLRHYMPTAGTPTLVFDAFAATEGGTQQPAKLIVAWPDVDLEENERAILARLCENVGYLGRAESWTSAAVLDAWDGVANAVPLDHAPEALTTVGLPALQGAAVYDAWRQGFLDAQTGRKKRTPPVDLWEVLHADTSALQQQGWSQPPGTRFVQYALLQAPFVVTRAVRSPITRAAEVVRLRVTSSVLPSVRISVSVGERMRQAVLSHSEVVLQRQLSVFTGKTADGQVLRGNGHAYWLPEDIDGDGSIDHIVGYAADGFGPDAVRVLQHIRRLWGAEGHDLELVLIEHGKAADLGATLDAPQAGKSPLLGRAREWVSRTPFVPPRHLKQGDSPEDQVVRLLASAGLPAPEKLVRCEAAYADEPNRRHKPLRWLEFRRERLAGGGARGSDSGFGFRIVFPQPVQGPIALGYGAHFGLGQFVAVR
jgi:CRISPR-associated protein Csb2